MTPAWAQRAPRSGSRRARIVAWKSRKTRLLRLTIARNRRTTVRLRTGKQPSRTCTSRLTATKLEVFKSKSRGVLPRLSCVQKCLGRLLLSIEEALEVPQPRRMAELAQRFRLNLADALARDFVLLANLFERAFVTVHQPETHLDDAPIALSETRQHVVHLVLQQAVARHLGRILSSLVLDEVAEVGVTIVAHRCLQRNRLTRHLEQRVDALDGHVHFVRDLFRRRLTTELLHQLLLDAPELVHDFDHVHRDTNGARLVGNGPRDRLSNPPRRVGREFIPAAILELL